MSSDSSAPYASGAVPAPTPLSTPAPTPEPTPEPTPVSPASGAVGTRLYLSGISKRFASTRANDDVSLAIRPGEIH
ncbi:MAG: hypothetical protein ACRYHA_10575, partial [Janthinobacterium lividum]